MGAGEQLVQQAGALCYPQAQSLGLWRLPDESGQRCRERHEDDDLGKQHGKVPGVY